MSARPDCWKCDGKGWFWTTPVGFNPFLAGGFSTARAMYRALCSCPPEPKNHFIEDRP